jgi:hypothetical protein
MSLVKRSLVGLAALALSIVPAMAGAQGYEHRFFGRVVDFAPYNLQLDRGPHIYLHKGTVLRPLGLNLQNGMPVLVIGHEDRNGSFQADEIDLADDHYSHDGRYRFPH